MIFSEEDDGDGGDNDDDDDDDEEDRVDDCDANSSPKNVLYFSAWQTQCCASSNTCSSLSVH